MCRTLINSLEYSLTCLTLAYFIRVKPGQAGGQLLPGSPAYLPLATLCVMIRPTAGLVWAPLVLLHAVQLLRFIHVIL